MPRPRQVPPLVPPQSWADIQIQEGKKKRLVKWGEGWVHQGMAWLQKEVDKNKVHQLRLGGRFNCNILLNHQYHFRDPWLARVVMCRAQYSINCISRCIHSGSRRLLQPAAVNIAFHFRCHFEPAFGRFILSPINVSGKLPRRSVGQVVDAL